MADVRLLRLRLVADAGILLLFVAAYVIALEFPFRSARYPLVICAVGALLSLANLIRDGIVAYRAADLATPLEEGRAKHIVSTSAALFMVLPCIGLFGMLLGAVLWLPLMLHFKAGMRWSVALLDAVAVAAFMFAIEYTGIGALPHGLLI